MQFKTLWLRTFSGPRLLAIDCGASHVVCGLFSEGAGGNLFLEQFACEKVDSNPAADGDWSDRIEAALAAVTANVSLSGACHLALPGHLTLTKFTRSPSVEVAKRESAIRFEARQGIPCPLETVIWDHLLIGDDGLDFEVMLAAAKVETIGAMHSAVTGAGFSVEQITPSGLALFRAFRHHSPSVRDGVVVADIGARSTNLVFIDGERWFMRTIALGANAVTHALAGELGIDFAEAEALKIQLGNTQGECAGDSLQRGAVQRAVAHFGSRLQLEIVRTSAGCRRHLGPAQPSALYLAGGGSLEPGLPGILRDSLNLKVVLFDPLRRVVLSPRVLAAGAAAAAPQLASLVGLATALIHRKQPAINLLPRKHIDAIESRRLLPRRAAAAVLALAAVFAPLSYYHSLSTATAAEIAVLDARLRPLRESANAIAAQRAESNELKSRVAALENLAGTKAGWVGFLTDLNDRIVQVGDVWLDRLQMKPTPANRAGAPALPVQPALRLGLSGRLLDVANPVSKVSLESYQRVKQLLKMFAQSAYVAAVENEHFDSTVPGILGFDCTLVVKPGMLL